MLGKHNIKDYTLDALNSYISFVLQKNTLFTGTIRENMLWGNNNATDEEVKVLNIYPVNLTPPTTEVEYIPDVHVVYKDGRSETIPKSALLKVWMEGRNSYRRV